MNHLVAPNSSYSTAPQFWPDLVVNDWGLSSAFPSWYPALLVPEHFAEEAAWEVSPRAQSPSPTFSFATEGDYLSPTQRIEAIAEILCNIGRRILNDTI